LKFLIAAVVVTVSSLALISAVILAEMVTTPLKYPLCCETPARFGANYESISFVTRDGLNLSGWYIAPKNGAVIILLHSYYGDRRQTLPVAEMLFKHGYGVLMYDQRASGESEGSYRSLGWRDIPDLGEAASWLSARQTDIKIGAFGCSIGAEIALAGALNVPSVQAIALDALSPLQWYENLPPFSLRDPFSLPVTTLYYSLLALRTQALPAISTIEALQEFGSRPILFISTGQAAELERTRTYFEAAPGPKEYLNIPEANHCTGPVTRPGEYEDYLLRFFDRYLQ